MRSLATAVVFVAASVAAARADHLRCRESSEVVGYHECSALGQTWSGITLAWQLGVTTQWFALESIDRDVDVMRDGQSSRVHVDAAASAATATAFALRNVYNFTEHVHIATELAFGRFADTRQLALSPSARDTMPVDADSRGWLVDGLFGGGVHGTLARVTVGSDLVFGPRVFVSEHALLPGVWFGQGGVAVEARAHAMLWLSPHWSVNALVARNLLDATQTSLTLSLGIHAFPYDGGR